MTIEVETSGTITEVRADSFDTYEGELSLYRAGSRVAVFAPGEWLSAEIVDEEAAVDIYTPPTARVVLQVPAEEGTVWEDEEGDLIKLEEGVWWARGSGDWFETWNERPRREDFGPYTEVVE